jgi:hypothetical protein
MGASGLKVSNLYMSLSEWLNMLLDRDTPLSDSSKGTSTRLH